MDDNRLENGSLRTALWLITIPTLMFGVIPLLVDMNETHVLNPGWPPHARLHTVWLITMKTCLATFSMYLLWFDRDVARMRVAGVIGICVTGSFWIAGFTHGLYGGGFGDGDGIPRFWGLDTNRVVFACQFLSLAIGLALISRGPTSQRP